MKRRKLTVEQLLGARFAVNVFIATTIVWFTLRWAHDSNPIWAIASMVAASDPQPEEARRMFRSRLINVLVGCAIGLLFLLIGGTSEWMLPVALAAAVLVSTYVVRVKTMWRQTPITAAVVIASGLTTGSAELGVHQGLHKVAEVVFGCLVGMLVSVFMSRLWFVQPEAGAEGEGGLNYGNMRLWEYGSMGVWDWVPVLSLSFPGERYQGAVSPPRPSYPR